MEKRILIVEDEEPIREMICFSLSRSGFTCIPAADTAEAQSLIMTQVPSLILLDWMLPGMSGLDFARRLRRDDMTRDIPVIMLTARGHEDDRIRGLDSGADDYLVKPFSPRELIARINAVMRRSNAATADELLLEGKLKVDLASHRVFAAGDEISLGPTEFRLLTFLVSHPERVYSRSQLLDQVWGGDVYIDERTVDVHVRRVRKALEPSNCDTYIQTVRGAGYRFSSAG